METFPYGANRDWFYQFSFIISRIKIGHEGNKFCKSIIDVIITLDSSTIDELGRWCLKVGGARLCTAGKEVSMVTLKRPPPT